MNTPIARYASIILVLLVLAVFGQTAGFNFTHYDDNDYVTDNPHVVAGLTVRSVVWAFTATHAANWHPLTWLSHMLDCSLYGLAPWGHHLTNILLHMANTLLILFLLIRTTGSPRRSFFVAALFAVHPLHVESVAWIAERKDVLSTFFFFLTLIAYVRYTERPDRKRYLSTIALYMAGLMAKPMLVTLPLILLLLDYWPLERSGKISPKGLLLEKLPFLIPAFLSGAITFIAQKGGSAVVPLNVYPLGIRLSNAIISLAGYLQKTVRPVGLTAFYPHPENNIPLWQIISAALLIAALSYLFFVRYRKKRYLATGWAWYLITLLPVIGIIQVGGQAMADRYTYIPLTGIFIAVIWGLSEFFNHLALNRYATRFGSHILSSLAMSVILLLSIAAYRQTTFWQNDITLFGRALAVTTGNALAHNNMGRACLEGGNIDKAMGHFTTAVGLKPWTALYRYNMAIALQKKKRDEEAIREYRRVIALDPEYTGAFVNLGAIMLERGEYQKAISFYTRALSLKESAGSYNSLGLAYKNMGQFRKAVQSHYRAVDMEPDNPVWRCKLANALYYTGNLIEAFAEYQHAITLKPDYVEAHNNLGNIHMRRGQFTDAIREYRTALETDITYSEAHSNLAAALYYVKDYAGAWREIALSRKYGREPSPVLLKKLEDRRQKTEDRR